MKHELFISYTQPDRNIALMLYNALLINNISVWMAHANEGSATSGNLFKEEIQVAISNCRVFILVYSQFSNDSQHIIREVGLAAEGKKIIPFRLDNSEMCPALKYDLIGLEQIDATGVNKAPAIERLISDIRFHLNERTTENGVPKDKVLLAKGRLLLNDRFYDDGRKYLEHYISIAPNDPEARFYLAIAIMAGLRPEELHGITVRKLENLLQPFASSQSYSYVPYLLALIKYGYYVRNGFRENKPNWFDLISGKKIDLEKSNEILYHINDVQNRVWQIIKNPKK